MARRIPWQLLVAAALLLLLAALATIQYRWLGEVSQAERERMRANLRTRATDFSEAFDRELTRIYTSFHVDAVRLNVNPARTLADAYTQWQSSAMTPRVVDAVYLLEGGQVSLMPVDPAPGALRQIDWPASLGPLRERAVSPLPGIPPVFLGDALDASIPAVIVNVPFVTATDDGRRVEAMTTGATPTSIVVVLNRERLRTEMLDPLVVKYFGGGDASEYVVTVVRRDHPSDVVYVSDPRAPAIEAQGADVTTGLFDLLMDEMAKLNPAGRLFHGETGTTTAKMAITIVHRGTAGVAGRRLTIGGPESGAWEARVRYRTGSLDAIVARSRRRNLAIGLGVLGLLAASFVLVIASAERQRRLARQQIEFVAAVSHELRTPLAVIRSAGENLADGVVAGDEQIKRYGALIEREGRRLTDMVERVMEFAGMASGRTPRARADVDVSRAIADAVASGRADGRERGVEVSVQVHGALPPVVGDADALRSALQNIVGNAIKYSPDGARVDVEARADRQTLRVTVADRGIGIDADDLPHVFKPFFRGRRASDAQIRGTGIGLSVVRHLVCAHGGEVRVESRSGGGTVVTVDLPVAPQAEPSAAGAAARNASA